LNIDPAIVERAKQGEREAYRQIVVAATDDLFKIIMCYTHNHQDTEDVLQETFLRAYRGLKKFRGDSLFSSWLTRIAINASRDHQRKHRVVALPLSEAGGEGGEELQEQDPLLDPARYAESQRIQREIDGAVALLTPFERAVFVLRHHRGYTTKEVAAVLGKAEGTIKNITFRALQKLRKRLEGRFGTTEATP